MYLPSLFSPGNYTPDTCYRNTLITTGFLVVAFGGKNLIFIYISTDVHHTFGRWETLLNIRARAVKAKNHCLYVLQAKQLPLCPSSRHRLLWAALDQDWQSNVPETYRGTQAARFIAITRNVVIVFSFFAVPANGSKYMFFYSPHPNYYTQ